MDVVNKDNSIAFKPSDLSLDSFIVKSSTVYCRERVYYRYRDFEKLKDQLNTRHDKDARTVYQIVRYLVATSTFFKYEINNFASMASLNMFNFPHITYKKAGANTIFRIPNYAFQLPKISLFTYLLRSGKRYSNIKSSDSMTMARNKVIRSMLSLRLSYNYPFAVYLSERPNSNWFSNRVHVTTSNGILTYLNREIKTNLRMQLKYLDFLNEYKLPKTGNHPSPIFLSWTQFEKHINKLPEYIRKKL
jgi:hypothetical protein